MQQAEEENAQMQMQTQALMDANAKIKAKNAELEMHYNQASARAELAESMYHTADDDDLASGISMANSLSSPILDDDISSPYKAIVTEDNSKNSVNESQAEVSNSEETKSSASIRTQILNDPAEPSARSPIIVSSKDENEVSIGSKEDSRPVCVSLDKAPKIDGKTTTRLNIKTDAKDKTLFSQSWADASPSP